MSFVFMYTRFLTRYFSTRRKKNTVFYTVYVIYFVRRYMSIGIIIFLYRLHEIRTERHVTKAWVSITVLQRYFRK